MKNIQNNINQKFKLTLIVDTNNNPTKKGIKVQFKIPENTDENHKTEITQKLQTKLNKGLMKYNLVVNIDTDVPYDNIIGFFITIKDIKQLIKNALQGGNENEKTSSPI